MHQEHLASNVPTQLIEQIDIDIGCHAAGVREQTGWLIDDQQVLVEIQQVQQCWRAHCCSVRA
jgi:hypothetical protein